MLQDRESRGLKPTQDTLRLLTGLEMGESLVAESESIQNLMWGRAYAS